MDSPEFNYLDTSFNSLLFDIQSAWLAANERDSERLAEVIASTLHCSRHDVYSLLTNLCCFGD